MYNLPIIQKLAPSVLTDHAHPATSDRYQFINTANVIERLESHGWLAVNASQNAVRDEVGGKYTIHQVRMRHARDLLIGKGSPVNSLWSEVIVTNSHNRARQLEVRAGLFRLACSNGLVVSAGDSNVMQVRHSGKAIEENIDAALVWVRNQAQMAKEAATVMEGRTLSNRQARNFARAALELYSEDVTGYDIDSMLQVRRESDAGDSLWRVFNRVQEALTRGGITRTTASGRNSRTTGLSSITRSNQLNEALWRLALDQVEA